MTPTRFAPSNISPIPSPMKTRGKLGQIHGNFERVCFEGFLHDKPEFVLRSYEMAEITYEIIKKIGVLSTSSSGWSKELNLISWNDREPKYDLRDWSGDHEKMGKGGHPVRGRVVRVESVVERDGAVIADRQSPLLQSSVCGVGSLLCGQPALNPIIEERPEGYTKIFYVSQKPAFGTFFSGGVRRTRLLGKIRQTEGVFTGNCPV